MAFSGIPVTGRAPVEAAGVRTARIGRVHMSYSPTERFWIDRRTAFGFMRATPSVR
jgi:hypothetical protein